MDSSSSTERLWARSGESRLAHWLFLDANRWLVAGVLSVGSFLALVALGAFAPSLRAAMERTAPVETTFQALIAALITGVTLVLSINQLVLSQELGRLGDQDTWMDEAMEFRRDVESLFEATGPPDPARFLQALVRTSSDRAETLRDTVGENDDTELRERTDHLVDNIVRNSAEIDSQLGTCLAPVDSNTLS